MPISLREAVARLDVTRPATRREFIVFTGALLLTTGLPRVSRGGEIPEAPSLPDDPFLLGVASGDPLADSVILWTRLHSSDIDLPAAVPVIWEVASDPDFVDIIDSGWEMAAESLGHALHVEIGGLVSATDYWYRFRVGAEWVSESARTRTLPAFDSSPDHFLLAHASCQNYRDGYYTAHAHLARENVDLVAFVGDYIYESGIGGSVRAHTGPPLLKTLEDYRERYALYHADPDLRAAHASAPWVFTWDDHEVRNNYANLSIANAGSLEAARAQRAAAYQAYYENLPLRLDLPDDPADLPIHHSFPIGDLVRFYVLDGRQYRSEVACAGEFGPPCEAVFDEDRTMLGTEQKEWLLSTMGASTTIWNFVAQQTVFVPFTLGGFFVNPDQWDGYRHEQQELTAFFAEQRNVIVLTGDIHAAGFAEIPTDPPDPDARPAGYEIVATSISSSASAQADLDEVIVDLMPHLHYAKGDFRGYTITEIFRDRIEVHFRAVASAAVRGEPVFTDVSFEVTADTREFRFLPPACPGDCNADGRVTIDELVHDVASASRREHSAICPTTDLDSDAELTLAELSRAAKSVLRTCSK